MKVVRIFPFHTNDGETIEKADNSTLDHIILRGIVCEKRSLDGSVRIYDGESAIEAEAFYWHPLTHDTDVIQKGLELIKEGLGFSKNPKGIAKYLAKRVIDTNLPPKRKNVKRK